MRLVRRRESGDSQSGVWELGCSGEKGWESLDSVIQGGEERGMKGGSTAPPFGGAVCGESRGSSSGGESNFSGLLEAPTGAEGDSVFTFSPRGRSFSEMAGQMFHLFCNFRDGSGVLHSKIQCSGEVFPLPENLTVLSNMVSHLKPPGVVVLQAMCSALNSYYGVAAAPPGPLSSACQSALEAMSHYAADWSECPEKFEGLRWDQFLQVRSIDYKGDEIRLAQVFRWKNLEPALPEGIGRIPLWEVCELGTLDYVMCFENYLLPVESRVYTKPPRVFADESSWGEICQGLISKGVCVLLPQSKVHKVNNQLLLNGLFGVSKEEFVGTCEVFRLIMNLVPVNKLCRNLGGDVATLPSWAGMTPYLLEGDQVLVMSSEDIRCFFYFFLFV